MAIVNVLKYWKFWSAQFLKSMMAAAAILRQKDKAVGCVRNGERYLNQILFADKWRHSAPMRRYQVEILHKK